MSESAVRLYGTSRCGYCAAARALLRQKGVEFLDVDIDEVPGARAEMIGRSGRRTVPQIFIGGQHVGGYDDLVGLDRAGRLDPLLLATLGDSQSKESPHE